MEMYKPRGKAAKAEAVAGSPRGGTGRAGVVRKAPHRCGGVGKVGCALGKEGTCSGALLRRGGLWWACVCARACG